MNATSMGDAHQAWATMGVHGQPWVTWHAGECGTDEKKRGKRGTRGEREHPRRVRVGCNGSYGGRRTS